MLKRPQIALSLNLQMMELGVLGMEQVGSL